jgi:hypothetical protein
LQIPKHVLLHEGRPIFKGLLTAVNEHKDIVCQFFLVSDSREQIKQAVGDMVTSCKMHGMPPVEHVTCDKPSEEASFWESLFPAVKLARHHMNTNLLDAASQSGQPEPAEPRLPDAVMQMDIVDGPFTRAQDINRVVRAMRDIVEALPEEKQVVSLDAEWREPSRATNYHQGVVQMHTHTLML